MQVTFKGNAVTLSGKQLQVGDAMPDFTLIDTHLQKVQNYGTSGIRVFLTVPSLDTDVCDQEVRKFNQSAAELPKVTIYAVSMDLPFAQARWCGAAGVEAVRTLSDYKDHSFGRATGTRIDELGLLTRAVFVVNAEGKITYTEYVPEITSQPDYGVVLRHLRTLM